MSSTTLGRNAVTVNKKYTEYFLPTVLTAMATNIAMIVDSIIAGNLLGKNALAAISLFSPISQLYFSLTILFGLGASSIVSFLKGKRDAKQANWVFTSAFVVLLALSLLLIAIQLPLANSICSLLTKDSELHTLLFQYYLPFLIGSPIYLILLSAIHFVRADARPQFASNIIIVANVVNLILDFVFMGAFKMGIAGSSIATMTGYAVGFIMMSTHFITKKSTLHFDFSILKNIGHFFSFVGNMVTIGLSGALGTMLITVKMLFLNTLIQSLAGNAGMVSYSVCSQSQIFMSMFITGASQTMIPIIGVCLGENDYDGVRYAFLRAAKVLAVSSIVITLFICAAPEMIIKFFGITSASDIANTIPALRINALSFTGLSFSFLLLYYYMATQKRAISTTISILNGIGVLIPSALILSHFFGITGVWLSLVATQIGTLVIVFFIDLVIIKKSKGKYKNFYLLEQSESNEVLSLSFKGTKEKAAGVSLYLTTFLDANGFDKLLANRLAVAVEEMAVNAAERMENKRKDADIDIRIIMGKNETIVSIRDNGEEFNPTLDSENDSQLNPLSVVRAISKSVEYSRELGFNRTIIKM